MSAPRVIFVHGAGGNASTFGPLASAWSWADLHVPDLPGRGKTPGEALLTVDALASWLGDVLGSFDTPSVVVGHSLGGAVALRAAMQHPARFRGLVMVSSGARLRVSEAILAAVDDARDRATAPFSLRFGFRDPSAEAAHRYDALAATTPAEATAADWRACDGFDVRDRLHEVAVASLVAWGRDDPLTPPRFQRWLVDHLERAEALELDGGHMTPWESVEALSDGVRRWVTAS
ncbi:MAG: alpha/beta hydrolase [Myxococcales bacterium]|nr:alpha/beta hydrolase [Myxococcales bacterium]